MKFHQHRLARLLSGICTLTASLSALQAQAACITPDSGVTYNCDGQAPVNQNPAAPSRLAVYNTSGPVGGPFVPASGADISVTNTGTLTSASTSSDVTAVGIFTDQSAGGATSINSSGSINANAGGIQVQQWNNAFKATVTSSGAITLGAAPAAASSTAAIAVTHVGSGNIEVNTSAPITASDSKARGITTAQLGTGTTVINVTAATLTTGGNAIHVNNTTDAGFSADNAGPVTVTVSPGVTVKGGVYGVFASTRSKALVTVTNQGSISGGNNSLTGAVSLQGNATSLPVPARLVVNNTGSISRTSAAAFAISTTNAGLEIVNDGTITGNVRSTPVSVANGTTADSVKLRAGAVTGNVQLLNGNDDVEWMGGTYAGTMDLGNGSDTLKVTTPNVSSSTAILNGGDDVSIADGMVDVLTVQGVTADALGANWRNWEKVLLDASAITFTDAALVTGSDPDMGLVVTNGGSVKVGAAFTLTGNLDLAAGTAFTGQGAGAGQFQNTASFLNAGKLALADGAPGDVYSTAGTYTGKGGSVTLDASATTADKLVAKAIAADSLPTALQITGQGGGALTQGKGILVVQVTDGPAASPANAFTMAPFSLGNFVYKLVRDAEDGNWYLQSTEQTITPPTKPPVPVPGATPAALGLAALGILGTAAFRSRRRKPMA